MIGELDERRAGRRDLLPYFPRHYAFDAIAQNDAARSADARTRCRSGREIIRAAETKFVRKAGARSDFGICDKVEEGESM